MREYDDHIRLQRPLLRRIIILMVVVTAVPVMLWSITTFVRSYVAQPKTPTFRPLAATASLIEATDSAAAATDPEQAKLPEASRPVMEARATATDARSTPTISIRKPDADANAPAGGSPVAATTTMQPSTTAAMPVFAQPMAPAMVATPAATGGTVWPDPPGVGPGNGPSAMQSPVSNDPADEALPPTKPLIGRIPLPPHRPRLFAMAQTPGAVPVPRPRPTAAPEATAVQPEVPVVDRLMIH